MMHKGDISAKVDLKQFENVEHLYALGAFVNLKGEIQIFNSTPINSIAQNERLVFDDSYNKKASLFVYAIVEKWKSINIPDNIVTYKQLESYIEQSAKEKKINI